MKKAIYSQGIFYTLFLFGLTQALGIWTAFWFIRNQPEILASLPQYSGQDLSGVFIQGGKVLVYFLGATLVFLLLIKVFKGGLLFKGVLGLAVLSGSSIALTPFLGTTLATLSAILVTGIFFSYQRVWFQNLGFILGVAGVGAMAGLSFNPKTAIFILVALSIYDWWAVFKTKHMVKMAKAMLKRKIIFGLVVPQKPSYFGKKINQAKPGKEFIFLGGGDLAFPLILATAALKQSLISAVLVASFAMLGLLGLQLSWIASGKRQPLPALPPLALASILGYIISLTLK